ncbi:hypothetical protein HDV06_002640 [Boothiomyces sp. JEL0866]|nr:hypothetical protein HDV06_002640 [Boothiomyces sp. JEL0866]
MDIIRETQDLVDFLFDCNKRDYNQVRDALTWLKELTKIHFNSKNKSYMVTNTDEENDQVIDSFSPKGLSLLQKHATPWLVSLMNRPPEGCNEAEFMDELANIMAQLCGRIATGETISRFEFKNAGAIDLKETSFTEAEIGFQTWGGGILLAKYIDEGKIDVKDQDILELGSGTGLAGLVCGRVGARYTVMSDYHPVVITNAVKNIESNGLTDKVCCLPLDWRWHLEGNDQEDPVFRNTDWKIIIAADCIFDMMHSELVPKVSKHYLSKDPCARFHVLLPHRIKFRKEIQQFQENMISEGWILEYDEWIEKHTLTFRYYIYKR